MTGQMLTCVCRVFAKLLFRLEAVNVAAAEATVWEGLQEGQV